MLPWLLAAGAGSALAWMPLSSVEYAVDVVGPLAEVRVEQVFVNDTDEVIEAVYTFPVQEQAAVDGMRMRVGDRLIEGVVLELQQAEEAYEEALADGLTAALTTQRRADVFTQQVGNIGPGEEVRVQLRVVQPVPHVDGAYELVLPLVVAPRFVRPDAVHAVLERQHGNPAPFAGPPVAPTDVTAGISVRIESALPFVEFECPSHDVGIAEGGGVARAVTARVPMDRDFVLRWTVGADRPLAAAYVQDGHLALTLEPPEAPLRDHVVPRELIWVIDESCSMSGQPIELADRGRRRSARGGPRPFALPGRGMVDRPGAARHGAAARGHRAVLPFRGVSHHG